MATHIKLIIVLVILTLISAFCNAQSDLYAGASLKSQQSLRYGDYELIMQSDCNLVLYAPRPRAVWSTKTDRRGTNCYVTMQTDANLVIYQASDRRVIWSSNTARAHSTANFLTLQRDRNLVIYGPNRVVVWASHTDVRFNGILANETSFINTNNNKDFAPPGRKSSPGKT